MAVIGEIVRFGSLEKWAVDYLTTALAGRAEPEAAAVYVNNKTPNPRHDRMVIVRRDGGPQVDLVREAGRLGIQVWARDDLEADALADLTKALLIAAKGTGPIHRVTCSGPSRVVDAVGPTQPLRYLTAEVLFRGFAA